MSKPILYEVERDFALASCDKLYVCVWRNETTMHGVESTRSGIKTFADANPGGIGLLTIVEPEAPMPGRDERDALAALLKSFGTQIKASALVFEGEGFRAAAVRSVVVGLNLLARQPYPHRVFDAVSQAASWLAPLMSSAFASETTAPDMIAGIAEARSQINAS